MKKTKLFFVFFCWMAMSTGIWAQSAEAEVKIFPVQDTLFAGEDHAFVIMKPEVKALKNVRFEISGPALASDVPGKPNYYRVYITGRGKVTITLRKKGKEIYKKEFLPVPLPSDPAKLADLRQKTKEVSAMLNTH